MCISLFILTYYIDRQRNIYVDSGSGKRNGVVVFGYDTVVSSVDASVEGALSRLDLRNENPRAARLRHDVSLQDRYEFAEQIQTNSKVDILTCSKFGSLCFDIQIRNCNIRKSVVPGRGETAICIWTSSETVARARRGCSGRMVRMVSLQCRQLSDRSIPIVPNRSRSGSRHRAKKYLSFQSVFVQTDVSLPRDCNVVRRHVAFRVSPGNASRLSRRQHAIFIPRIKHAVDKSVELCTVVAFDRGGRFRNIAIQRTLDASVGSTEAAIDIKCGGRRVMGLVESRLFSLGYSHKPTNRAPSMKHAMRERKNPGQASDTHTRARRGPLLNWSFPFPFSNRKAL